MPWFHQRPNLLTMYGSLTPLPFQRRFTPLASAGMQYYTIPTWTASGDFEIELEFSLVGTPSNETLLVFGKYLIRVQSDTGIRIFGDVDVGSIPFTVPSLGGQLHSLKVSGNSTIANVSLELDGVSYGEKIGSLPNFTGDSYIGRFATAYTDSYIANVSLQTSGDNRLYRLDENFGETTVAVDSLATLGSEEIVNGDFSDGISDWVAVNATLSVVSGELKVVGTANTDRASQNVTGLTVGVTHRVSANIKNGTASPEIIVWNASQTVVLGRSSVDGGEFLITPTETTAVIWLRANAGEAFFDNISLKEATGYGTAINIAESQLFTEVADGWEGVEKVREADVTSLPWVSLGNNNYAIDGTNVTSVSVTYASGFLQVNSVTRVELEITNYVSGILRLNNGSGNSSQLTADDEYALDFATTTSTSLNFQALGAGCEYDLKIKSIKQFLEVA